MIVVRVEGDLPEQVAQVEPAVAGDILLQRQGHHGPLGRQPRYVHGLFHQPVINVYAHWCYLLMCNTVHQHRMASYFMSFAPPLSLCV